MNTDTTRGTVPLWEMALRQWNVYKERYDFDKAFSYVLAVDRASADAKMKMCLSENVLGGEVTIPQNGHDRIPEVLVIPAATIPMEIQLIHFLKKEYVEATEFRRVFSTHISCESYGEEYPYLIHNVELGYDTKGFSEIVVNDWLRDRGRRMLYFDEVLALVMLRPSLLDDHAMLAGMSRWKDNEYPGFIKKLGGIVFDTTSFKKQGSVWGVPTCSI